MYRTKVLAGTVAVLLIPACAGEQADESTSSLPPTSVAVASSDVDACIVAINRFVGHVDLAAENATAELEAAFNSNEPASCAFLAEEDPAGAVGLSAEDLLTALESGLQPPVIDFITRPDPEPFEHTSDEL
ncbi:MAG: hypothetical protein GY788_03555 [bacterium]|nr:hypothetical protein [bacterium]